MAYSGAGSFATVGAPVAEYQGSGARVRWAALFSGSQDSQLPGTTLGDDPSNGVFFVDASGHRKLLQFGGIGATVATTSRPQQAGGSNGVQWLGPMWPGSDAVAGSQLDQAQARPRLTLNASIDKWGAVVLGVSVALVLLYLLTYRLIKHLKASRLRMDPKFGGAFRLAAARGDVRTLHALAEGSSRFHVDADHDGWTALHAASVEGKPAAVLWLCQRGADVAAVKGDGWMDSPLMYAAARGHSDVCQVLMAFGASLDAINFAGATAADLAVRSGHRRLADYLRRVSQGRAARPTPDTLAAPLSRQIKTAISQYSAELHAEASGSSSTNKPAAAAAAAAAKGGSHSSNGARLPQVAVLPPAKTKAAARRMAAAAAKRAWEGVGSQGTQLAAGTWVFRCLAVVTQAAMTGYVVWRALRTLNPGWNYFFSIPYWLCEFAGLVLSNAFIASMWNQIDRPKRRIGDMLAPSQLPGVDVFIATYSEPVEVLEPTVTAALNINYPGSKLSVHVLDDGRRPEVAAMCKRLRFQARYMGREAELLYVAREKVKGVRHHDKAGNINSALLKESPGRGTFVLILDCDMIVHPDFIQATVGHFYTQPKGAAPGTWVLKDKAAFIQTPQDFWNIDREDPLVHAARFFYGPMLQGRDGIGACPCCGTGVVFRRDVLVSLGGQSYGSITEDYNTAMNLLGAGFATMFLQERLVFGMAPEDIEAALKQRLRWAMGALQILSNNNPLAVPGLSTIQSLLFFEALAHHYLALSTTLLALLPIPFLFTGYSAVVAPSMAEFTLAFGTFYALNRLMLWWAHHNVEGAGQEMWRGSQMWVWMAPNHLKAIWKVKVAESWVMKKLFGGEIKFAVTKKAVGGSGGDSGEALSAALACTWPYLLWIAGFFAGVIYFLLGCVLGRYTAWDMMVSSVAVMWGLLIVLCLWPPLATLLPREETEEGWRIRWDAILPGPAREEHQQHQGSAAGGKPGLTVGDAVGSTAGATDGQPALSMVHGAGTQSNTDPHNWTISTDGGDAAAAAAAAAAAEVSLAAANRAIIPVTGVPELDYRLRQRRTTSIAEQALHTVGSGQHTVNIMRVASGSGQQQQSTPATSLYYSAAANAARATGSNAIGRIAMPGRTVAVAEAASLLTHIVLPEPLETANSQTHRMLAVSSSGMVMPTAPSNLAISAFDRHMAARAATDNYGSCSEGGFDVASGCSVASSSLGFSYSYSGSSSASTSTPKAHGGASNTHHRQHAAAHHAIAAAAADEASVSRCSGSGSAASSPAKRHGRRGRNSLSGSGGAAAAAVMGPARPLTINTNRVPSAQEHAAAAAGTGVTRIDDGDDEQQEASELPPADSRHHAAPLCLSSLAAAVQSLSSGPGGSPGCGTAAAGAPASKADAAATGASGAGSLARMPVLLSSDAGGSDAGGLGSECAVIPALPSNIYECTLLAQPNFSERTSPASNRMMLLVNVVLLGTLVAASMVEVYGPTE